MKAKIFLGVLLIMTAITGAAQSAKTALTNAHIIKMFKTGLENDIILTTIESSPGKYDVTPDGLVSLKTAGVPSPVIKSMQAKMDGGKTPQGGAPVAPAPSSGSARVPQPENLNAVYAYNKSANGLKPLEKANATLKTRGVIVGTTNVCEIQGNRSEIRLSPDQTSFVINTGGASPDALRLLKLDAKGKSRSATLSKVSAMAKQTGVKGNIPCQIKVMKPGVFEIIPESKLDKGEYFFTIKQIEYTTMSNLDVYAFGVD